MNLLPSTIWPEIPYTDDNNANNNAERQSSLNAYAELAIRPNQAKSPWFLTYFQNTVWLENIPSFSGLVRIDLIEERYCRKVFNWNFYKQEVIFCLRNQKAEATFKVNTAVKTYYGGIQI